MSADLSRVRFDPLRDHSGVGIQQGRLWLDADFNEQVAITGRRLRAQVVDLSPGRAVVSRLTPDAFAITLNGGKLSIGAGRMYVDGLLAENHGADTGFDAVLAEPNGSAAVAYEKQPYWPDPDALPRSGRHLVYLDVWERELTHLNTPDLVDSAIGVDTTIRSQVVWQVRVLSEVGEGVTCGSEIPKWDELIAPSSARLTTGTEEVEAVDDPCEIPPGTGYRGPENQLYRVELHSPTEFKWSRDNASVGSAVVEVVSATSLRLQSLGRDDVLSIKDNDWVEITDDGRELSQQPGEMRQVTIDAAASTITFTPALPAELTTTDRHLRVRKWDSPLVTIPANGGPVSLEHGITVSFAFKAKGRPRPGDHWVFAARATAPTPDESLEKLTEAPPRGIHHHYARLAVVTMPGSVQDCRPDWPTGEGDGCGCQICVTPQQHNDGTFTISDAIERLIKAQGGTLILCPGTYQLREPVRLTGARSIRVLGPGARLETGGTAIEVSKSIDVALEDFEVVSSGGGPGLRFAGANRSCRVERLRMVQKKGIAIDLSGVQQELTIGGCRIEADTGLAANSSEESKGLLTYALSIHDNLIGCRLRGIDLGIDSGRVIQHTGRTTIHGNTVIECRDAGIVATGLIPQDVEELDGSLDIRDNTIEGSGSGIVTGSRARIHGNTVIAATRNDPQHGLMVEASPPGTVDGEVSLLDNRITGAGGVGIGVAAPMRSLIAEHNLVRGASSGIVVQDKGQSGHLTVTGNQVLDLNPFGEDDGERTVVLATGRRATGSIVVNRAMNWGIFVTGGDLVTVHGNIVNGVAAEAGDVIRGRICAGIIVMACREGRISGNTVSRIGHPESAGNAHGIAVGNWHSTVSVGDNSVLGGAGAGAVARPGWFALLLSAGTRQSLGRTHMAASNTTTWTIAGDYAYAFRESPSHAQCHGNTLQGGVSSPAAFVTIPGDAILSANQAEQPGVGEQPVVRLKAGVAVVQGNRLRGGRPSMIMDVDADRASVIGNITSGGIQIQGTAVENTGKPWSPLNPIA